MGRKLYTEPNCRTSEMDGSHTINEVPVLIIINDERYGGIAHSTNTGKTYCMVPTTAGNLPMLPPPVLTVE